MKKIIWAIVAILLVGYFANSYVENNARDNARREAKSQKAELNEQKAELNEQKVKATVEGLVSQSNAITDWATQLSNGEIYRLEPILTIELEKLWLVERPILFVGSIQDIKTNDDTNYSVLIERNLLSSLGNMYSTDLQLSLIVAKDQLDAFLEKHPNLFKGLGFDNDIAVTAKIHSIETIYISGEECAREEIKIGYGDMLGVEFVGGVRL